jgi:hypothetical protein
LAPFQPNLGGLKIDLVPSKLQQLPEATSHVISNDEERRQIRGKSLAEGDVSAVFQEAGTNVILDQHLDFRRPLKFFVIDGELERGTNVFEFTVYRGVGCFLLATLPDVGIDVLAAKLLRSNWSKQGQNMSIESGFELLLAGSSPQFVFG